MLTKYMKELLFPGRAYLTYCFALVTTRKPFSLQFVSKYQITKCYREYVLTFLILKKVILANSCSEPIKRIFRFDTMAGKK